MKQYVLGVGTGKSGTHFLAKVLNNCIDCNVYHELRKGLKSDVRIYQLNWHFNKKEADLKLLDLQSIKGELVGDIAFYYPNYIKYFYEQLKGNLKVVEIYRDLEKVQNSMMKFVRVNHWMDYDNPKWRETEQIVHSGYDKANAKANFARNKKEAIGFYWVIHRYTMQELMRWKPEIFFSVDLYDLNFKEVQDKLFNFLKIPKEKRVYTPGRAEIIKEGKIRNEY